MPHSGPHLNSPSLYHSLLMLCLAVACGGCSAIPDVRNATPIHNPFPQLKRIAILPFFNQSSEPTLDPTAVTEAYYAALQSVPGFEVLPVGVVRNQLDVYSQIYGPPRTGEDFQAFAQMLGVDAVVQGSVTDFTSYYPPRMGMTVHWYAANPGFHPIPPGYGLPWGTKAEKDIPSEVVLATEFELARQQLATQTPTVVLPSEPSSGPGAIGEALETTVQPAVAIEPETAPTEAANIAETMLPPVALPTSETMLPAEWPDPSGLIPDAPQPFRPVAEAQHEPVLTHTRLYDGADSKFTERLANHVSVSDDKRSTNWQAHLSRTDDFVRFCCRLHLTEMLEARGGADRSDLILRWPIGRYRSQ